MLGFLLFRIVNCRGFYMFRCRFLNYGLYIAEYTLQHCHLSVHSPEARQNNYIIDYDGTKEEIDKWFDICVNKLGVKSLSADVEEHWYIKNKDNIPQHVIDLCLYIKDLAKSNADIHFEYFDRIEMIGLKD